MHDSENHCPGTTAWRAMILNDSAPAYCASDSLEIRCVNALRVDLAPISYNGRPRAWGTSLNPCKPENNLEMQSQYSVYTIASCNIPYPVCAIPNAEIPPRYQ